jgi:hypothetical protein
MEVASTRFLRCQKSREARRKWCYRAMTADVGTDVSTQSARYFFTWNSYTHQLYEPGKSGSKQ